MMIQFIYRKNKCVIGDKLKRKINKFIKSYQLLIANYFEMPQRKRLSPTAWKMFVEINFLPFSNPLLV